ncbi:HprK-related kinase A [Ectothiorhodospira variabilis]|uniref:HprK-related kinase A n=1 Tax=Ectothiorhodospira variabilis TaxID=505694 RepID=UPI001EFB7A2F|nr:HprK-related kinase A [Ectothiorhodospira variabilis]MCG5497519.1 HprK-related kinase A [Ectothiorhodospira variabilis]
MIPLTRAASPQAIDLGPFKLLLTSDLPSVHRAVDFFYHRQRVNDTDGFFDFHVRLTRSGGVRSIFRPQARFFLDGSSPFKPLPLVQAYPLLEWGLNWCIAQHAHHFLMVHAAVVERGGSALVMPGAPGAGKSTLTAAMALSGWRLLSDEFALVSLQDGLLTPLPRPVSLKNAAIDLIQERYPHAVLGPKTHDTTKGTVAHLKQPDNCIDGAAIRPAPRWLVFPRYDPGAADVLTPLSKGRALLKLGEASFNYSVLGESGFRAAADLVEQCDCFELVYGHLDTSLQQLDGLRVE